MTTLDVQLIDAARGGRLEELESLLRNPGLNINKKNVVGWTPLHFASSQGHAEAVKLLLAHPNINVNVTSAHGQTAFLLGCWNGRASIVQLLLKDPRVDTTLADHSDCTPWWHACRNKHREVIEWLIASGRDLGDIRMNGDGIVKTTAVVPVAKRFMANPVHTRREVRAKLGVLDGLAAEVFALIVFLCDDLLELKPALASATSKPTAFRFFAIMKRVPMELQMILCHRVVESAKDSVLSKDSEAAFKVLARILILDFLFG